MNIVADKIREEIEEQGPIFFARFMEQALYCPEYGFYEKEKDTVGRRGDFYTSVSVGPVLGQLLGFQFAEWLTESRFESPRILEAGAHDGRLAKDILEWLRRHRPELFARIEYVLLEPSARRRKWQEETLREFAPRVRWMTEWSGESRCEGVLFCNELLDALPVNRVGLDSRKGEWFEWGVGIEAGRLAWKRMGLAAETANFLPEVAADVRAVLPDNFTIEVGAAAVQWWRDAARQLKRGKLVTLDYGLEEAELLSPQRAQGTLRAYREHRLSDDVLADPGEQDLTAHVNFTAIRRAGEAANFRTTANVSQAQFLTDIARRVWQPNSGFGEWTSAHTRQFQTLTHPEHLGRAFRVLVQER